MAQQSINNGVRESVIVVTSPDLKVETTSCNAAVGALQLTSQASQPLTCLESDLATLVGASASLKAVSAALHNSRNLPPAQNSRFLTRLGLHLIATVPTDLCAARRLLALAGVVGVGQVRDLAARALAKDKAYDAEFQALIVAAAVAAGNQAGAARAGASVRAQFGYSPSARRPRRASTHRCCPGKRELAVATR